MGRSQIVLLASLIATPALAESTRAAMQEFGIVGTWSVDCSVNVMKSCAATKRCVGRITISAPLLGTAKNDAVVPTPSDNPLGRSTEIVSASRVTSDKLRVAYKINQIINGKFQEIKGRSAFLIPTDGEEWESVYVKKGDKLQVWSSQRTDSGKISIQNGEQMMPVASWSEDQGPVKQWQSSGQSIPLLERCTGE